MDDKNFNYDIFLTPELKKSMDDLVAAMSNYYSDMFEEIRNSYLTFIKNTFEALHNSDFDALMKLSNIYPEIKDFPIDEAVDILNQLPHGLYLDLLNWDSNTKPPFSLKDSISKRIKEIIFDSNNSSDNENKLDQNFKNDLSIETATQVIQCLSTIHPELFEKKKSGYILEILLVILGAVLSPFMDDLYSALKNLLCSKEDLQTIEIDSTDLIDDPKFEQLNYLTDDSYNL